jgi:hypothetical protein
MRIWDREVVENLTGWYNPEVRPQISGVYEQLNEERRIGKNGQAYPVEEYGTGFSYYNVEDDTWSEYRLTIQQALETMNNVSCNEKGLRWRGVRVQLENLQMPYYNNYGILGEEGVVQ